MVTWEAETKAHAYTTARKGEGSQLERGSGGSGLSLRGADPPASFKRPAKCHLRVLPVGLCGVDL